MSICIFLITSVTDWKCSDHFETELKREKEEEDRVLSNLVMKCNTWLTAGRHRKTLWTEVAEKRDTWHTADTETYSYPKWTDKRDTWRIAATERQWPEVDWETRHIWHISYCCRRRTLQTEVGKLTPNALFPLKDNVNCGGLKNVTPDIRTASTRILNSSKETWHPTGPPLPEEDALNRILNTYDT